MKRVLIIAVILEWLKYTFAGLLLNLSEGFFSVVTGIIFFIWFLPEMMIGGEHPPHHWYTILGRLVAGVGWNLPAALYFAKLLPDQEVKSVKSSLRRKHKDKSVTSPQVSIRR
jgi:hypothetical protein